MSLASRFAYAADEAGFWKKALKPAFQPYVDYLKDSKYSSDTLSSEDLKQTSLRFMAPVIALNNLTAASVRFTYHLAKGPN